MALVSGSRLGSYEIAERIGAGGMGEVYRATDTALGRQVALKILPDAVAADSERLARFDREAKILATLSHSNIAAIYGVERSTGTPALVMELVDGPTLADRIAAGPIPIDEAIEIAKQIAAALEGAHHAGVMHRDLKPANIKLREDGVVKVLDFGLAKTLDPPGAAASSASLSPTITSPALTVAGVVLGTAAYMSPEQARGRRVDHRADIWAFGCVLFEMITGRRPFGSDSDTVSDTLAAILKSEADWRALPTETPTAIKRLLRRCLAKDPRERLHHIADARLELRDAEEGAPEQTFARPSIARSPLVLAVAAAIVGVAGISLFDNRREPASRAPVYRTLILPPSPPQTTSVGKALIEPRLARGMALSPDGDRLAFGAPGPTGRTVLWIRRLDALSAQPLVGTEGALNPFWSPDGRRIAFFSEGSLKRIDAAGGLVAKLADKVGPFSGGSWNERDVILFARGRQIVRVSAAGGAEEEVTKADAPVGHSSPFFLPGGRQFLYAASEGGRFGRAIHVGSIDGGQPKKVREGGAAPAYADGHLLFIEDNVLTAQPFDLDRLEVTGAAAPFGDEIQIGAGQASSGTFSVSRSGVIAYQQATNAKSSLVWFDLTGKPQGNASEIRGFSSAQLSPDGRHLAVSIREDSDRYRDLWIYDTTRWSRTRFTDEEWDDFSPIWSPDGTQIVYASMASGERDLNMYIRGRGVNGTSRRLLNREGADIPTSWSNDGQFILFQTQAPNADIFVLTLGDLTVEPFANSRFVENAATFSPDGQWIAYVSDETGRAEVYVAPRGRAAERISVSAGGGMAPRWRRDGRELYYLRADNTLIGLPIRLSGNAVDLGSPRELFAADASGQTQVPFDVASDGRLIILRDADDHTPPAITLIINWPAGLTKQ